LLLKLISIESACVPTSISSYIILIKI
jgi:hypothetical protein